MESQYRVRYVRTTDDDTLLPVTVKAPFDTERAAHEFAAALKARFAHIVSAVVIGGAR
jgi:hypothetical protein